MRKIHTDLSPGEFAEGNSQKFIILEGNNVDEHHDELIDEEVTCDSRGLNLHFTDEDSCSSTGSQEQELDLNGDKSLTNLSRDELFSLQPSQCVADIDALYTELSNDFYHHTKTHASEQSSLQQQMEDSSSETESLNSETVSDDSIAWSSGSEIVDTGSDDDDKEHSPIFQGSSITYEEHIMAIMSMAARHNLNQAQLSDLIDVIKLHCPDSGTYISSVKSLHKEVTGDVQLKYHDVCEDCFALFPEDVTVYRCSTTGCSGYVLWFTQSLNYCCGLVLYFPLSFFTVKGISDVTLIN